MKNKRHVHYFLPESIRENRITEALPLCKQLLTHEVGNYKEEGRDVLADLLFDPTLDVAVVLRELKETHIFWFIYDEGTPIAFAATTETESTASITLIAIDERHRRSGLGNSLLAEIKAYYRITSDHRHLSVICQINNTEGCAFYEGNGFTDGSKIMYLDMMSAEGAE